MTTLGEADSSVGRTFDIDQETNVTYDYSFNREMVEYTMTSASTSEDEKGFGQSYYTFDANL